MTAPHPTSTEVQIVAVSGGADSSAMSLLLREREPDRDFRFVCTVTGNEMPGTAEHLARLSALLGQPIEEIPSPKLIEESHNQGCLPSTQRRWCTRVLKINPTLQFLTSLARNGEKPVLCVGLRADEEERQGLYSHAVRTRFPLREWGFNRARVEAFLVNNGIRVPDRTDCALCPYQRIFDWWLLWNRHPEMFAEGVELERQFSEDRGKLITIRSRSRDSWPADLASLAQRFEAGDRPPREMAYRQRSLPLSSAGDSRCRVCSL